MSEYETEIDIHGMTVNEAISELDYFLEYLPDNVKEVVVIHGYRQGKRLLDMVRKEFQHNRIERKIVSMNPGITVFLIKIPNR